MELTSQQKARGIAVIAAYLALFFFVWAVV